MYYYGIWAAAALIRALKNLELNEHFCLTECPATSTFRYNHTKQTEVRTLAGWNLLLANRKEARVTFVIQRICSDLQPLSPPRLGMSGKYKADWISRLHVDQLTYGWSNLKSRVPSCSSFLCTLICTALGIWLLSLMSPTKSLLPTK